MKWKEGSRRSHTSVEVVDRGVSWAIALDGQGLKASDSELLLPTRSLALAIADEWRRVGPTLSRSALPLTGLAVHAAGPVSRDPAPFRAEAVRYGQSDLVCYRASQPEQLSALQSEGLDPLLFWLAQDHGIVLQVTTGLLPVPQDPVALARLGAVVAAFDPFGLTALLAATHALGSIVIGLALLHERLDATSAFALSRLDEAFQISKWGADAEASVRAEIRQHDVMNAARFATLSKGAPSF